MFSPTPSVRLKMGRVRAAHFVALQALVGLLSPVFDGSAERDKPRQFTVIHAEFVLGKG